MFSVLMADGRSSNRSMQLATAEWITDVEASSAAFDKRDPQLPRPALGLMRADFRKERDLALLERVVIMMTPTPVAVVTDNPTLMDVFAAIDRGARGFLLEQDLGTDELKYFVQGFVDKNIIISSAVAAHIFTHTESTRQWEADFEARHLVAQLNNRERDVLVRLADGLSNAEISRDLLLSIPTVKEYVSSILVKLKVRNRVQAAVIAHRAGLAERAP